MTIARCLVLFLVLVIGPPVGRCASNVTELYTPAVFRVIQNPDHVFASLLKDEDALGPANKRRERTRRIEVSPKLRRELIAELLSADSYVWNMGNPCVPVFGARLTFVRGNDVVQTDFCFRCNQLQVTHGSAASEWEDFARTPRKSLYVFQTLFPKDRELQKVRPKD